VRLSVSIIRIPLIDPLHAVIHVVPQRLPQLDQGIKTVCHGEDWYHDNVIKVVRSIIYTFSKLVDVLAVYPGIDPLPSFTSPPLGPHAY
jgi:hypothetical protein